MILAKFGLDLAEGDRARDRRTQSMPAARDGDRRSLANRRRLERRLAESAEAIVAGDAQIDRHDPLANQAMSQVAGHVGFALAGKEVPAGRLDRQADGPAQLTQPLPLEALSTGDAD